MIRDTAESALKPGGAASDMDALPTILSELKLRLRVPSTIGASTVHERCQTLLVEWAGLLADQSG